jgi:NhaP-type Na+/H+ or K+/H+ antiporter
VDNPALTFAIALAAGIAAQSVARHLRIPGIVLLLGVGILLGPDVANIVRPETLGHGLDEIVGLAVAVVLFEGGLNLRWQRLRAEAWTIRRLITIGGAITAGGGAAAAILIMGWDWRPAALFGSIVTVTGPTVITPLLRRIRVKRNLQTILEAEAVLIDPIGAVLAVVLLEFVLATTTMSAAASLLGLPIRLAAGTAMGVASGLLLGRLLRSERVVPEGYENIFTLAMVLALFEVSNAILPESGIMAAAVAGLVVGNMRTRVQAELKEFKEQLTVLLVGLLFVLLAADVRVAQVVSLGWPGALTVLALMLLVRPADVAVSTAGSDLTLNDRLFLSWMAPRGIVAAAIASLFARRLVTEGIPGGNELLALVFLVIAATVVLQGGTTGIVASALGVRRPLQGWAILGANALGRALAWSLERGDEAVVMVDRNAAEAQAAQREGHHVVYGDASQERTLLQAAVESKRGIVGVTPSDSMNLLLARRAVDMTRVPASYVAVDRRTETVTAAQVSEEGSRVLFGREVDIEELIHLFLHGSACVERWRREGGQPGGIASTALKPPGVPLVLERNGKTQPVDEQSEFKTGDVLCLALPVKDEATRVRLREEGWVPVETDGRYPSRR